MQVASRLMQGYLAAMRRGTSAMFEQDCPRPLSSLLTLSRTHRLLNRGVGVWSVAVEEVHIVHLQALQGRCNNNGNGRQGP